MARIQVLVLRAAGTNCDGETVHAWERAGAAARRVHLRELSASPRMLRDYQILTIPGGFSYGDDIAAGRILAARLQRMLADDLQAFVDAGKLILGICNGFQVLVKAGLLRVAPEQERVGAGAVEAPAARARGGGEADREDADAARARGPAQAGVTVTFNQPSGFQCRWVTLRCETARCAFLEAGRSYDLPIAHGEGRVVFASEAHGARAAEAGQYALAFAEHGPGLQPASPNGSAAGLAGLCDETGRILGLMPHPERYVRFEQHPQWGRAAQRDEATRAVPDGLSIFRRGVEVFA